MGWCATLTVGLIAGWLASIIMKVKSSLWLDLIMGVIGAVVGGFLAAFLFNADPMQHFGLGSILWALLGAIVVIAIYRFFTRAH